MHKTIATFTLALTLVLVVCLLVVQPFPLLHDFPEWMYQGWLFHHLMGGTSEAISQQYVIADYPVPNSLSQVVMGGLNFLVTPVAAGRIWLLCYFALAAALWWHLYRRHGDSLQQLLLTSVITLGPGFWNGYINFQFALLWFALYLVLDARRGSRSLALILPCSALLFFSHAAVYLVFLLYVVLQILVDPAVVRRKMMLLAGLLPSVVLIGWYSVVLISSYGARQGSGMGLTEWVQYKAYTLAKQGPFHNFILHNGESFLDKFDLFYKAGFVANFLFAALLGLWLLVIAWDLVRGKMQHSLRQNIPVLPVVLTLLVCFAMYLVSGSNTFGVVNLGERFLIAALLIVLLCCKCPPLLQRSLGAIASVFMLYAIVAITLLSGEKMQQYTVARSSDNVDLTSYVDDIYASSRHQYFNHRIFIYADRGLQLQKSEPEIIPIDLATSVVHFR